MSLINQMLKDLEARHEGDVRGRLHREVRPLPVQRDRRMFVVALWVTTTALVAGMGAWFVSKQPDAAIVPPETQPSAVAATAVPAGAASSVIAATATGMPHAPQAEALPSTKEALEAVSELKLSATLERPPVEPVADAVAAVPRRSTPLAPVAPIKPAESAPMADRPATSAREKAGGVEKVPAASSLRERSEAEYRRAISLVNAARVGEAVDVMLDVLGQDGGHVGARQLVAKLLIEQRRFDEAMAILAEGLTTQPAQIAWAMTLARLQVDRGDLAAAGRTLQASLPHGSASADYLGFCGLVQHRLGNQRESAEHYQNAARLAPGDGRWWLGLGLALEAGQRISEARESFTRARATGTLSGDLAALVDQKLR